MVGELVEEATFAVDARVVRNQHLGQLAVVLRVELVEGFLDAASVRLGGAEEDGFTRQHAVGVLDRLFHELAYDQRVGAGIDDLLFELGAFEVDFLDFLAFEDQRPFLLQKNKGKRKGKFRKQTGN